MSQEAVFRKDVRYYSQVRLSQKMLSQSRSPLGCNCAASLMQRLLSPLNGIPWQTCSGATVPGPSAPRSAQCCPQAGRLVDTSRTAF